MYREIIVPVVDAEGVLAIPQAAQIARAAAANLCVIGVAHRDSQQMEWRERIDASLDGVEDRQVESFVLPDRDAAQFIVSRAQNADQLVCMAGGQHHTLSEPVRGTVAERVVNACPHPLVIVGPRCEASRATTLRRLVVALDESVEGDHALDVAALWARAFALELVLVEAVAPEFTSAARAEGMDVLEGSYVSKRARAFTSDGVKATWDVLHAKHRRGDRHHHLADTLSRYAADVEGSMLVIATKGRAGVRLSATGSTTHRLLTHAEVPVLVTHRGHDDELAEDVFLDRVELPAETNAIEASIG